MNFYHEKQSKKPAYLQLYEQLRRAITEGVFPYGSKLPSKRLLAEEAGVSVITVEHTYAILADEGYIEPRCRSGCYVIYRRGELLSVEAAAPSLPQGGGHHPKNDFPFSVLAKTMRRVLSEQGERILVKSPNRGCAELRSAIAAYMARSSGIRVGAEQVVIGSGAEYLYSLIAQLLGGRAFAVENPCYDKIRRVYQANGVPLEPLKLGADGIKAAELARTAATVLHVTPFNSYPSGVTASATKRRQYLDWAAEREGFIIEDNFDSELTVSTKHEEPLFSQSSGNVLYLNTFSQTIAPSIRVGYLLLPEGMMAEFEQKLGFYSCTVPVFEQFVLAELLNNGDFERHVNRVRRARRKSGYIKKS